jgi:hypothetical protein
LVVGILLFGFSKGSLERKLVSFFVVLAAITKSDQILLLLLLLLQLSLILRNLKRQDSSVGIVTG